MTVDQLTTFVHGDHTIPLLPVEVRQSGREVTLIYDTPDEAGAAYIEAERLVSQRIADNLGEFIQQNI